MKKISNAPSLNVIIPVIAMVLLAAQTVSGAGAYLKSVGPPPLRFEVVDNNNVLFLMELALPKSKPVSQPPMPAPQAEAKPETNIAASGPVVEPMVGNPILPYSGEIGRDRGDSASDMLSITPQMISEYFKPNRTEAAPEPSPFQHGQSIFVPAELGFVPPTPGSKAIYNSK